MFLSLSLEEKIGQLFFIGIPGPDLDSQSRSLLQEIQPGGICLFQRNCREAAQVRNLLDDLRAFLPIGPILSLDQEGGLVDRLRRIIEPMPAASALRNPEDAGRLGRITAEVLSILGFNMNFAPVTDVTDESRRKFQNGLQSRCFGSGREDALEFSREYLKQLQAGRILGSIKHFPGLGASEIDSHEEMPAVNLDEEAFSEIDLYPYRELLKGDLVKCVMIAHMSFPNLSLQEKDTNGKLLPSSLSYNFISGSLRKDFGFEGLVLTDDMEMGAILKNYGMGEACKMAVKAGVDMPLICASSSEVRNGFNAVLSAVRSGEISLSRIEESLQRINLFKNLMHSPPEFDEMRLNELSNEIKEFKERLS